MTKPTPAKAALLVKITALNARVAELKAGNKEARRLTPASADLLNKIEFECDLFDGGESGEVPFLPGELSKAEAGNLLDLKVKGLITTCEEENHTIGSSETRLWITFTDKYRALYIPKPLVKAGR